ncbi:MAG: phosphonate ABC transporter, permease protein PhnE [Firmicutes bacterium]|nr:phosphonate ABC transporter, permease protein PhnE [Bacillota bacterium]
MYGTTPGRRLAVAGVLTAAIAWSVWVTGFAPSQWDLSAVREFVAGMFPPDWTVLPTVIAKMGETIGIAFLGTLIAFLLAFPLSFAAARGLSPDWIGAPVRGVAAFFRAIPEILWALLFLVATDLGNISGILALAAHNVGILTKLMAEVYEAAPAGPQEAVLSTGAAPAAVVWHGILPWSLPHLFSHLFFRFECNIRTATVLGLVGAGGIGHLLMLHRSLLQYDRMLVDTLGILALVLLSDALGALVRRQVT